MTLGASAFTVMVNGPLGPARFPTFQRTMVLGLAGMTWLAAGVAELNTNPGGKTSSTTALLNVAVPALLYVSVQVTVPPGLAGLGVDGSRALSICGTGAGTTWISRQRSAVKPSP